MNKHRTCSKLLLSLIAAMLAIGLAGCGSKEDKKPASQVAAKVNNAEISVHQINYILSRSGASATNAEQAGKLRREVLEKLIEQQIAVDQAIEKKLDRSPEVMSALEAARREVLARAYAEQIAASLPKPTPEEARDYYAKNPALFAERRIYNIQEIVIPEAAGLAAPLREMIAAGKPMEDIVKWLKAKDVKFGGSSATRAAEQIPLELLPKVYALKDGQGLVLENGGGLTVMRLVASQSQPIVAEQALPRIQMFLANQRAGEAASKEMKGLRERAQVSYVGEFATATGTAPAPQAVKPAAPEAEAAAKVPAPGAIEKGVAGLK